MAIDTIGNIDLELAEREASSVERESQALRGLGGEVGSSLQGALKGAEVLQKQAIDEQKTKEADALLKSGAQAVNQYVQELNAQGANLDQNVYNNMAENVKTPEGYKPLYVLARKTADKQASDASRQTIMSELQGDLKEAMTTANPELIAKIGNKINFAKTSTINKDAIKQLESIEKGLNDVKARSSKSGGGDIKAIADKLKLSREEAAFFDKRIKEAKIIKDKAAGVRVAVSRAMDNAAAGKDPNNSTLDQVLGVTLQKVLDPPSVVRESEFARLGMTQSFLDMMKGKLKGLSAGGIGLTDESRAVSTQFIEDMNEIADRAIRKQMMTSAVRAGFGDRFDLQEIDAQLFSPEEVAKMKDIHEGRAAANDEALDERIRNNVKLFLANPDMLSGGKAKSTKGVNATPEEKPTTREEPVAPAAKTVKLPNGKVKPIGSTFRTRDGRTFRIVGQGQYEEVN